MNGDVIALVGGPLDGVFIPAHSDLPTQVIVNARPGRAWSVYEWPAEDGIPVVDVYVLRVEALARMTTRPKTQYREFYYSRSLTPPEVLKIKQIGRKHGL